MKKEKFNKLIFGLAGIGVLAGLCYLRRKDIMHKTVPGLNSLVGNTTGKNDIKTVQEVLAGGSSPDKCQGMTPREKKELQDRIKAMTTDELEAVIEVVPVELCMKRIQNELDHAREFESMIKKAYEMK